MGHRGRTCSSSSLHESGYDVGLILRQMQTHVQSASHNSTRDALDTHHKDVTFNPDSISVREWVKSAPLLSTYTRKESAWSVVRHFSPDRDRNSEEAAT